MNNIAETQEMTLAPVLPYPLNLDPDDQPYREWDMVSRDVTLFNPELGKEYGLIARVGVKRHSSDPVAYEQYAVQWSNGEVTDGHFRQSLTADRWKETDIIAAENEAEGFQANIAWE